MGVFSIKLLIYDYLSPRKQRVSMKTLTYNIIKYIIMFIFNNV